MKEFDPGPPEDFAELFSQYPDHTPFKEHFWFSWGPIFYRGRLDGSARLLCVASDPGPTERIACRSLVGDAGQRVQGFLTKLGLTRSYVCLNAFVYAFHPSHGEAAEEILADPAQVEWRNRVFDEVKAASDLKAVVAFGNYSHRAVELWTGKGGLPVLEIRHPSSRDEKKLLDGWRAAVEELRNSIGLEPDADGDPTVANYGDEFLEEDYSPIPKRDLPFGLPDWFGDDSWGRKATPRHNNCVRRPYEALDTELHWMAPGE
jgi:hypothetical protein